MNEKRKKIITRIDTGNKMNLNELRTTLQKVSSIRNLITIFILLLSISSASAVPMRIWNTVFYDNYPTSTQVQWAQQMHADVILIPEDVITTSMITQFKNAGFSVWLGLDPVLNHATGQTFDITNPTIRAQRIQYVKDLVNANPGISGIQYEELQTGNVASMNENVASMNDFLTQTTNFLRPKGIYVTFNIAQMNPPFTNLGFDLTYIDSQRLVDAVFLQIGDKGLSASKDAYDQWNGYMPNTLIVPYAYGWTADQRPTTTTLFTVIDYFNTRGMPVSITQTEMDWIALKNYPELNNLNPNYVLSSSDTIAVVIGRIPIAGSVVTPIPMSTPISTPIPMSTPISTPIPTPTPTSNTNTNSNKISNPGFESGTVSWNFFTSGTGAFSIVSQGYEGNNAARLALNSGGTNIQLYQTGISMEPGTRYRLSFAAYSNTGHDITLKLFKTVSPYNTYAPDFTADLGTNWKTFTTEFNTTFTSIVNDGRLMFWLSPFAATGDTYYIDDIRLEKVGQPTIITQPSDQTVDMGQTATFSAVVTGIAPLTYQWQKNGIDITGATNASYTTPSTSLLDNSSAFSVKVTNLAGKVTSNNAILTVTSKNLIENPGFESGTSSWSFYTNRAAIFTVESPGYEGIKAANIALSSSASNVQLYQKDIALEPNTRYRLSFAAYSNAGDDVIVNLFKHDSPYTDYGLNFRANLNTGWQTFTTEFTTKGFAGNVNDGRLMFWLAPFAAKGDIFYIDNVRLEKVN